MSFYTTTISDSNHGGTSGGGAPCRVLSVVDNNNIAVANLVNRELSILDVSDEQVETVYRWKKRKIIFDKSACYEVYGIIDPHRAPSPCMDTVSQ